MIHIKKSIIFYLFFAFFNFQTITWVFAQKITFVKQDLPSDLKTINCLRTENEKYLWIASGNGLFKWDNGKTQKFLFDSDGKKLQVNTLEIDDKGNKWLEVSESDFDCDGGVDIFDLAVFADCYMRSDCEPNQPCGGDFNDDGEVNLLDFSWLGRQYGLGDCLGSD